jgi:hypothetical protein
MHRRIVPVAAVAAVALLLAGCSDDRKTAIGPPLPVGTSTPAQSPGTTTAPVRAPAPTSTTPARTAPARTVPTGAAPRSTAPAPPAVRPAPVAIPAAVMLRGSDWPGGTVRTGTTDLAALPQTEPSACQARTAFPSDRLRRAARTENIDSGQPESGGVFEQVVRYAPGGATQALAEMRRVLAACHSYRPVPEVVPGGTRIYSLESERFAGDDALLVRRADQATGRQWADYWSIVRLGDALVVTDSELGEGVADARVALRLATVGAARAACLRSTC